MPETEKTAHTVFRINFDQIPRIEMDILSRTLLDAMERFYSDPENVRRFEEWLKSKEGQADGECSKEQKKSSM